jgi:hypothetical protein
MGLSVPGLTLMFETPKKSPIPEPVKLGCIKEDYAEFRWSSIGKQTFAFSSSLLVLTKPDGSTVERSVTFGTFQYFWTGLSKGVLYNITVQLRTIESSSYVPIPSAPTTFATTSSSDYSCNGLKGVVQTVNHIVQPVQPPEARLKLTNSVQSLWRLEPSAESLKVRRTNSLTAV